MKALIALIILVSYSCSVVKQNPINMQVATNNKDYKIEYLFSHDGCKMYRFTDRGNIVYFSNCTGETTSIVSDTVPHIRTINRIK